MSVLLLSSSFATHVYMQEGDGVPRLDLSIELPSSFIISLEENNVSDTIIQQLNDRTVRCFSIQPHITFLSCGNAEGILPQNPPNRLTKINVDNVLELKEKGSVTLVNSTIVEITPSLSLRRLVLNGMIW